jgi:hypothetical protein
MNGESAQDSNWDNNQALTLAMIHLPTTPKRFFYSNHAPSHPQTGSLGLHKQSLPPLVITLHSEGIDGFRSKVIDLFTIKTLSFQ